jgi:hypothetical protein
MVLQSVPCRTRGAKGPPGEAGYYDALLTQVKGADPKAYQALQKRQDAAHRRHLSAIKTLATVRKLLVPARSPVGVATGAGGVRPGVRLHEAPAAKGSVAS